jgi:molecular chaperone DnaJ
MSRATAKANPNAKKDLYKVLGVERTASSQEIRKAYFGLAKQHHPDKGGDSEVFKEIQTAHEVLTNEQSRKIYDMTGQLPGEAGSGPEPGEFPPGFPFMGGGGGAMFGVNLDELFGMFGPGGPGGGGGRPGQQTRRMGKPPPKIQNMNLTLKQFYFGQNFNLNLDRQRICRTCEGTGAATKDTCTDCKGTGGRSQILHMGGMAMETRGPCPSCQSKGWKGSGQCGDCQGRGRQEEKRCQGFSLQPGMRTSESVVLSEVCSEMAEFERPGDLHVVFNLDKASSPWQRTGKSEEHLLFELTLNLAESLLGAVVKLDGHPSYPDGLWVRLPACSLEGDRYCLADLGMPLMGQTGRFGNAYVLIHVSATTEQRSILSSSGRTGNLEELFGGSCRTAADGVQESDIFTEAYLVTSPP